MSFLHPALLLALPAVLIPLIIHLLHRRRFPKKSWGAMLFLREALQEKRGRRKLRHWLLLAMRMLVIAALILAMSRPVAGGWLAGWFGGGDRNVVLLMDRSASMERRLHANGPSKREMALETLTKAWEQLQPTEFWVQDSVSGEIRSFDRPEALAAELTGTDTSADLPTMIREALDHWEKSGQTQGELWIVSDLQANNWRPREAEFWAGLEAAYHKLTAPPDIRLLTFPGGQANRSIRCRTEQDQLEVTIRQEPSLANTEARIPLTLSLGGQETIHDVLLSGESTTLEFDLPPDDAGTGRVSIPDDGNPRDNSAHFAFHSDSRPKVVLVCEDDLVEAILALAVAPWPDDNTHGAEIQRVAPENAAAISWENQALVVWQGNLPPGPVRMLLQRHVETGGQLLFFPNASTNTNNSWGGFSYGETVSSDDESGFAIERWTRDEGPLRDTRSGEALPLSRVQTLRYKRLEHDGGITLAMFANGEPCLISQSSGEGTTTFCTTLPLDAWSTLGDGLVLLPLIQRLLTEGQQHRSPVRWTAPSSPPWQAGAWPREEGWEVAERPAEEDSSAELSELQLEELLGGIPYQQFSVQGADAASETLSEWWRLFLFLALVFLLAENLLTRMPRQEKQLAAS